MIDNDSFIGKYMGNYRLVAKLDSGSYGSVYTGKHRIFTDDPAVAIKILHAHLNSSYEHDKFIQEAQLLKKLNHSHILPIRDAGIGRKPFMVEGVQIEAVQYQHAKVTPVAPTQLNPHLPMHIEQAILTAMAKDRTNRHSDIAVFVSALHKSKTQWLAEGDAHYDAKRYEEALLAYEQALHLDPNDAAVYFKKGNILSKLKRYEEALAAYEQALRLNPNDAVAYNNKGNAFYRLKRYEEALAACEQALRLALNSALDEAIAYNNTSLTLERLGRLREAQQAREKARQLGYKG